MKQMVDTLGVLSYKTHVCVCARACVRARTHKHTYIHITLPSMIMQVNPINAAEREPAPWIRLKAECPACDMVAVAFFSSARPEDIYRVWAHTENLPAADLARRINQERGPPPNWIYPNGRWADSLTEEAVTRAREMLDRECAACVAGTVEEGCIGDGTCVCVTGWTGDDCSVECRGGFESPCRQIF